MANTYNWDFPQLDTAPTEGSLTDVVKTIHWRFTATSDTETNAEGTPLSVSAYGTTGVGDADPDDFTDFDSLTQDWCKEIVLTHLDKTEAELETMLSEQLQNMIAPPIVGKVPANWS
jgi:hypothetical protein